MTNLCDTCAEAFAICDGNPVFGCDTPEGKPTDDNVVKCDLYHHDPLAGL